MHLRPKGALCLGEVGSTGEGPPRFEKGLAGHEDRRRCQAIRLERLLHILTRECLSDIYQLTPF